MVEIKDLLDTADETIDKCKKILEKKSKLYGTEFIGDLGLKGEFLQIHRKYTRLRQILWNGDNKNNGQESNDALNDALLDMINACIIIITLIKKENGKTKK